MSSDRGSHFICEVLQQLSEQLSISWDFHTPWRPQYSGSVKQMNQTLKRQISKMCQETSLKWPQVLPLALLRIRVNSQTNLRVSPYELMFGGPYSVTTFPGSKEQIWNQEVEQCLVSLGKSLNELKRFIILQNFLP